MQEKRKKRRNKTLKSWIECYRETQSNKLIERESEREREREKERERKRERERER